MTKEEGMFVVELMMGAEGGCSYCAYSLLEQFVGRFPEFKEDVIKRFDQEFWEGEWERLRKSYE